MSIPALPARACFQAMRWNGAPITRTTGVVRRAWTHRLHPVMPAVIPSTIAGNDNVAAIQKRFHWVLASAA